ncbi:copper resistance protein CopC [Intrasporangium oryzae NRRL B-24470]|uniref:Copper resistance protein CopC n=1 Tax=Intrasporangium oryzae NRRL B-24470 TaxID=1386089 RepID=W9GI75_9MICO|nr:copper resistance CopC family protein [Intrasporangium oryzae]EWT03574.1 copper resistance protein CopC [Intrasporangium oryzae NRRL B-24470]
MHRLVSLLLALGLVVALPASAVAHDVVEKTTPSDGSVLEQLPGTVTLTFAEAPLAVGLQVVVTGPTGKVSEGTATVSGLDVVQPISPAAPGGDYTVGYRVTSSDGHPVTGTFHFYARVGLDGSTASGHPTVHVDAEDPAAGAKDSQFVPIMLTIVSTLVLLGIGAYVFTRVRR